MTSLIKRLALVLVVSLFLSSCQSKISDQEIIAPIIPTLTPSLSPSPTPAPTVLPSETPIITPAPTIVVSPTPAPTVAEPKLNIKDYFPIKNVYFQYKLFTPDGNNKPQTEETYLEFFDTKSRLVQKRVLNSSKKPQIKIYQLKNGEILLLDQKENLQYIYNFLKNAPKNGEILLKSPLVVGTSWKINGGESFIYSTNKKIGILGGLSTIQVNTNYNNGNTRISHFAKDLGLVCEYVYDSNQVLLSSYELSSYEKDVSFKQSVKIYFLEYMTNQKKYVKKSLLHSPNNSMENIFTQWLQTAPSNDLLSLNTKINKISLGKNNSVTIDFSSQISNNMVRQNEKAFLQTIADTIGSYYNAKRVYITINDQLYESNYIFLTENDYFVPNTKDASSFSKISN